MNNKKFRSVFSIALCLVMMFSCLSLTAGAADDVKIVKKPDRTTFYQGIDWSYNKSGVISIIGGSLSLTGTVLSYNNKEVSYSVGKWPNMYSKSDNGQWKVGSNTIKIYCDDYPSSVYATLTVKFVAVESISIVTPPSKTALIEGTDWNLSALGDVEFTELDMTGTKLLVKYTDGVTKNVSYPENQLISWAVPRDIDFLEPGEATLYATFGDKKAPFRVNFIEKNAKLAGDLNSDYKINSLDALMILQFTVGSLSLDSTQKTQADVSKDNKINSLDALMILQYSVGILPSL